MNKLSYLDIRKMVEFVSKMDIGSNPEPAAIFDPLTQGFNVWAIPSDHPGGDWERVVDKFDAGAFTKRCKFVGTAFYNHDGFIEVDTMAYALEDEFPQEYSAIRNVKGKKSIKNRPDDVSWVISKVEWVFQQIGMPCPEIRVGED